MQPRRRRVLDSDSNTSRYYLVFYLETFAYDRTPEFLADEFDRAMLAPCKRDGDPLRHILSELLYPRDPEI